TLGRLGRSVAFLGRLSRDRFGSVLRAGLAAEDVDLRLAPMTDASTLLAVAELDADGTATYRFYVEGTAAPGLSTADLPVGLPPAATALHVGTLGLVFEPMAATIETLVAGLRPDVLLMADPNCRPTAIRDPVGYRARLERVLGRVDVVKVSVDDLAWLDPGADPVAAARRLMDRGPAAVLVTDGTRAVRLVTATGVAELLVPAVRVVDTVGAGDAFGAGFLAAWTAAGRGRAELADQAALAAATRFAIEVGALTTTRAGAEPPTLAELAGAAAV
ncbi:MAG TPA: PfkB family carbohydrate kinase, partial [Candidatus Limnocylindrales bacterium]